MEAERAVPEVALGPSKAQADRAVAIVDEIITDIYFPFGGAPGYDLERKILVEAPNVPHNENIAEHSWHLAFTVRVLYDERENLGLVFPPGFNIDRAVNLAVFHDVPEIWTGDVDAMTPDLNLLTQKSEKTKAALFLMRRKYPYTAGVAHDISKYEEANDPEDDYISPEAEFVSDVDKILGTRIIALDGGKRWHHTGVSREYMCERMRSKLLTENGHAIFDALERDLDNHPEYFPTVERVIYDQHGQFRLF